jgi:hypothetical protein
MSSFVERFFTNEEDASFPSSVLARNIRELGENQDYFQDEEADIFEAELAHILIHHGQLISSEKTDFTPAWQWNSSTHEPETTEDISRYNAAGLIQRAESATIRVTDDFLEAIDDGTKALWQAICENASKIRDTTVEYDSIINDWNTTSNSGRIDSSGLYSAFHFLEHSVANQANLAIVSFLDSEGRFDIDAYQQTINLLTIAQDILVDTTSYPSKEAVQMAHDYRPLALSYSNLDELLSYKGIAFDSPESLATAGALTAILTGTAYRTSSVIAERKGNFNGYAINRDPMLRVISKHRAAVYEIDSESCAAPLLEAAHESWDDAVHAGEEFGFRNAQTTVLTDPEQIEVAAAQQPFISGGVYTCITLTAATHDDVSDVIIQGWKLGLKGVRLEIKQTSESSPELELNERSAVIHTFVLEGRNVHITVGLSEFNMPQELFITATNSDNNLLASFAQGVSLSLREGVALETLVAEFAEGSSLVSLVFQWLGTRFLEQDSTTHTFTIAAETIEALAIDRSIQIEIDTDDSHLQ